MAKIASIRKIRKVEPRIDLHQFGIYSPPKPKDSETTRERESRKQPTAAGFDEVFFMVVRE